MAYVINRLNRNVIGQFKSDFNTEYDRTKNSYTKFNSSFMFNCSDAYITQMRKKIVDYYNTIGYLYNSLNDWWNAYNYNLNHIENAIIEKNSGFVTETSIKTAIKQLPALRDFRFNLNSFTIPDDYVANFNKIKTVDKIEDNIKDKTSNPLEFSFNFVKGNINAIKEVAKDKTLDFIAENETAANIAMFATGVVGETYANSSEIFSEYGAYAVANFYSNQMKGYSLFSGNEYNMQDNEFLQKIQGFIDKDYSGEAFDSFYKNNEFGKTIYENSTITDKTREFQKQIQSIQEKTMATTALAAISVTEGITEFGEEVLDIVAYKVGNVISIIAPDSGASETIANFISDELTTDHFNWLQDNTLLGAEIKEEAVAQDLVRGVGVELGKVAGVLGVSALTGGVVPPAAVGFVSGSGRGAEEAFQSGADYSEAGANALCIGGLDALQYILGAKVDKVFSNVFGKALINGGMNGLDMSLRSGAKTVFFGDEYKNELLKSINYDENGNQISNKTWDDLTFAEQYGLAYNADGGHSALVFNVLFGAGASVAGDSLNLGKYFNHDQEVVSSINSIFDQVDINSTNTGAIGSGISDVVGDVGANKPNSIFDNLKKIFSNDPKITTTNSLTEFFDYFNSGSSGKFGANQGVLNDNYYYTWNGQKFDSKTFESYLKNGYISEGTIEKIGTVRYGELKNKLKNIGFSNKDASVILSGVDSLGACSYASTVNEIFVTYRNYPDIFEQTFGFPMHILDENGFYRLNEEELLLDLYLFANDTANGGILFDSSNGIPQVVSYNLDSSMNYGYKLDASNQNNMSVAYNQYTGRNQQMIESYLKSKNPNLNYNTANIYNYLSDYASSATKISGKEITGIANDISNRIERGELIQMIYSQKDAAEIRMLSMDSNVPNTSTASWGEGGGAKGASHSVFVTGVEKNGFVVSSWGAKYLIPYEDLKNGGSFMFTTSLIY